jgi:hypothetical protein
LFLITQKAEGAMDCGRLQPFVSIAFNDLFNSIIIKKNFLSIDKTQDKAKPSHNAGQLPSGAGVDSITP